MRRLVRHVTPDSKTLLDVGCGTGEHLRHLLPHFDVAGLDSSQTMLRAASVKLPTVQLHLADMRTFRLDERFDAVICMFSSIGYAPDLASLDSAIASMAMHLAPCGVLIIEPWHHANVWPENHRYTETVLDEAMNVKRAVSVSVADQVSTLRMHYEIADVNGLHRFEEEHALRLFSVDEYLGAFDSAGLSARHLPIGFTGRGLFIAKP